MKAPPGSAAPPAPTGENNLPTPSLPAERTDERRTETGTIVLLVSQSAKVRINDRPTTSTGKQRTYQSQLKPGASYRFQIEVEDRGQVVQRDIVLRAGQTTTLQLSDTELAAR